MFTLIFSYEPRYPPLRTGTSRNAEKLANSSLIMQIDTNFLHGKFQILPFATMNLQKISFAHAW